LGREREFFKIKRDDFSSGCRQLISKTVTECKRIIGINPGKEEDRNQFLEA